MRKMPGYLGSYRQKRLRYKVHEGTSYRNLSPAYGMMEYYLFKERPSSISS